MPNLKETLWKIKNLCRQNHPHCLSFNKCWNCSNAFTNQPNVNLIGRCVNPQIQHELFAFKVEAEKNRIEAQKNLDNLWIQAGKELQDGCEKELEKVFDIEYQEYAPQWESVNSWQDEIVEAYYKSGEGEQKAVKSEIDHTSWISEIQTFMQAEEADKLYKSEESKKLVSEFLATFEQVLPCEFQASFFEGSVFSGVLIPKPFEQPNKNSWSLSPSLKPSILKQLVGKPIVTTHKTEDIRSHVGIIRKAWEEEDSIKIEALLDDENVAKVLKREKGVGLSIAGSGKAFCKECNKEISSGKKCEEHPDSPLVLKELNVRHVALTDSPAFQDAKVENFSEEE